MNHLKTFRIALLIPILTVASETMTQAKGNTATVKGYVLDSACAFTKDLKKPVSPACAVACAKSGSPLAILADDGTLYLPISRSMPATGQNSRLMKFAGKRVSVTGEVLEKGGSHALIIEKIELAPSAGQVP